MKLYIIPTPIGNLEDITLRAIRILKEVDAVLAEDTRVSGRLLQHLGIEKPIHSFHAFNEHKSVAGILERLKRGETLGLISDAGTPGISDPAFLLVRECIRAGINVECLPGPVALIPALIQSGLPCDRFVFMGFLPPKKGRKTSLEKLKVEERTMVFYESPHRLLKALDEFIVTFGTDRPAFVCRELTKMHEENARGSLDELKKHFETKTIKGEIVIVVQGSGKKTKNEEEE